MDRSTDRILTSHVGSLPRPGSLLGLYKSGAGEEELATGLTDAVAGVVARQREIGIDVVNDGEYGKPMSDEVDYGAFMDYAYGRITGFEFRDGELSDWSVNNRDFVEFADYYASPEAAVYEDPEAPVKVGVNVAEITYTGQAQVARDIRNLKAALASGSPRPFMTSMAVGSEHFQLPGEFYASEEEQLHAMAATMRQEYQAIVDAGLIVQLDDPWLVDMFSTKYSMTDDVAAFRRWAEQHVELINESLRDIPADRIRLHVCWGSWKGPHSSDLPLTDVLDLLLKMNVGLYSVEAANPRHEHEWRVWEEVDLPEDKIIMPGVVSHKTNVLEHPELVADRIVRYANAVGRENVIAGTDCGMGGRIHPQIAWAKLGSLVDGAELASRRLWG